MEPAGDQETDILSLSPLLVGCDGACDKIYHLPAHIVSACNGLLRLTNSP